MAEVYITFKVMPESPEHIEAVKKSLEALEPAKLEEEPIGFGLVAFKLIVALPEESGVEEEYEKKLLAIDGVNSVETLNVTRGL